MLWLTFRDIYCKYEHRSRYFNQACTCSDRGTQMEILASILANGDILRRLGTDTQKLLIKISDGTQTPPSVPTTWSCGVLRTETHPYVQAK